MANMELIQGVSFSKGCYPGQEVVARLHYLGKASRRMYRVEANNNDEISAGDDIYQTDSESNQSIGKIVATVREDDNKLAGLAILRIESAQQLLAVGSPTGSSLRILSLPYEVTTGKK